MTIAQRIATPRSSARAARISPPKATTVTIRNTDSISNPEAVWRSRSRIIWSLLLVLPAQATAPPASGRPDLQRLPLARFPELRARLRRGKETREAAVPAHHEREPRRAQEAPETRQVVGLMPSSRARRGTAVLGLPPAVRTRGHAVHGLSSCDITMISLCDHLSSRPGGPGMSPLVLSPARRAVGCGGRWRRRPKARGSFPPAIASRGRARRRRAPRGSRAPPKAARAIPRSTRRGREAGGKRPSRRPR